MRQCLQERADEERADASTNANTPNPSNGSDGYADADEELLMTFFSGPKVLLILDNIGT